MLEKRSTGRQNGRVGVKYDAGRPPAWTLLKSFSRAISAVVDVGTFGAEKYSLGGWEKVDDGQRRYSDALVRHMLKEMVGEDRDQESGHLHAAHEAWNALARLELKLRGEAKP